MFEYPPLFSPTPACKSMSKIQFQQNNVHRTKKCWHMQYAHTNSQQNLYNSDTKDKKRKERRVRGFWFARHGSDAPASFSRCWSAQQRWLSTRGSCASDAFVKTVGDWSTYTRAGAQHNGGPEDYSSAADRQERLLAMYTFVVGPGLPHAGVIFSGRVRTPGKTGSYRYFKGSKKAF